MLDEKPKRKSPPPFTEEHRRRISETMKGRKSPWSKGLPKGYKHSEETCKKISLSFLGKKGRNTGNVHSNVSRKKMSDSWKNKYAMGYVNPLKGSKLSEEQILKLSQSHKGYKPTLETRQKIRKATKLRWQNGFTGARGKTWKLSEEARRNHSLGARKGKDSHLWKGGITPINKAIRKSLDFRLWREAVFKRDNYTCQNCEKRGGLELHPHHIKPFALFPELRLELSNGQTLCSDCHRKTDSYGVKTIVSLSQAYLWITQGQ